ncbi:MAG: glycerol-3-phosphate acyltransferase, partial [Chloroflexi bacterium]|nr:glycerol-3-phosphate acyltransferase [Chloroflexota bacterium]
MLSAIVALAGSYLIGSIPTAYLMVKALKQTDVRTVGSGNVGASNVTRVAGKGAGAVVFALDLSKGLMAVLVLAPWLTPDVSPAVRLGCGCL